MLLAKASDDSRKIGLGEELPPAIGDIVWMALHHFLKMTARYTKLFRRFFHSEKLKAGFRPSHDRLLMHG